MKKVSRGIKVNWSEILLQHPENDNNRMILLTRIPESEEPKSLAKDQRKELLDLSNKCYGLVQVWMLSEDN